jgi:hypothetical protein
MRFGGVNYSRQLKRADCAVTAVANSIKWSGKKISYGKEFKSLAKVLKLTSTGTQISHLKKLFKQKKNKLPFDVASVTDKPTITEINTHLDDGGAIIYTYIVNGNVAKYHTVLIVKRFGNQGYYFINESRNSTITIVENRTLKKYLKKHSFGIFITKKVEVR